MRYVVRGAGAGDYYMLQGLVMRLALNIVAPHHKPPNNATHNM
jgi:hypothetical protein